MKKLTFHFSLFLGLVDRPNFLRPQGGELWTLDLSMTPPNFLLRILLPLN